MLDIGCSGGVAEILLAREGKNATGIDRDAKAIAEAEDLKSREEPAIRQKINFIRADFLQLECSNRLYDTVMLSDVLQEALFPQAFIQKALGLLKEGGILAATVPFGLNTREPGKTTYYLFDFLELFLPHAPLLDYGVLKGRTAYVKAVKARDYDGMLLDLRDVMGKSEKAFLEKEKRYAGEAKIAEEIRSLRKEIRLKPLPAECRLRRRPR